MKFLFVVCALVAVATGSEIAEKLDAQGRSVSSQIVDWIEAQKEQMPCGFPSRGLGPLSPAHLSHKKIHLSSDSMDLEGEIMDFNLFDLDNFDIEEFRINMVLSRANFKFHWKKVHFETLYKLALRLGGLKLNMNMGGNAKFAIEDLTIWGQAKYRVLGKVRLTEFKTYVSLGDVTSEFEGLSKSKLVNKKMNEIIEEWIMLAINDNTDNVGEITNSLVVPIVNNMIGEHTLPELIGIIAGGGGGEGEPKPPKEPCVPGDRRELFTDDL